MFLAILVRFGTLLAPIILREEAGGQWDRVKVTYDLLDLLEVVEVFIDIFDVV
jgi:hypothetical protein